MIINIHATGIELTPALKAYAEEKYSHLEKFFPSIQQIRIDIGLRSHHHHKGDIFYAEVNLFVGRKTIRVVKDETDLYKAIDKVKDHLKVELEAMKEKMRAKDRTVLREMKESEE